MTKTELMRIRNHIETNIGFLPTAEILTYYEMFMNGSDRYLLGVEYDKQVYGFYSETIPLEYCSCQTDHKANDQFLRFRPYDSGAKKIAAREDSMCFGSTDYVYTLYTCNNKQGFNSGYCFELAVFEKYGIADQWRQDNKASTKGGDLYLNGEEVQMKFVKKGGLATITSARKIIREIDRIIKIMEM
jgi:hypothetical protein